MLLRNIVLMVFWITVTVSFDNIYEEQIYSCITLAVLTIFRIVLFAVVTITNAATIDLLLAPLAFFKPDFFADIPVLFFIPPTMSLLQSRRYSPRPIGTWWVRGDNVPCSAECSIRNIPVKIRARTVLRACTDRVPIGSSVWWRNCSNKNRKYRTNRLTSVTTNWLSAPQRLGLTPLVVAE